MRKLVAGFRRNDLLLLLFLASIWGTAFTFITIGLDRFTPFLFASLRFDITGALLLAIAAIRRKGPLIPQTRNQWMTVITAGLLMTGAYHAFLFWGQDSTTSGIAAIIVGLSPVLTIVFTHAFLHDDRLGWRGILGVIVGLGGIIILGSLKEDQGFDAQFWGETAIVAAITSWALGSVLVKRAKHGMEVFSFAAWQALVGALGLHLTTFVLEGGGEIRESTDGWSLTWAVASLLYLAVISSGIGFIIYFKLVESVGPIRVNLVSYIAPVFANIAAILILKEVLELRAIVAFALIVTSLTLVIRTKAHPPAASAPAPGGSESEDLRRVAP
ncbi:MAG TPA: EamA family transporter [Candidatus Thermoplasmatota archaeon]